MKKILIGCILIMTTVIPELTHAQNPFQDSPDLSSDLKELEKNPGDSALTNRILLLMNLYSETPLNSVADLRSLIADNILLAGIDKNMSGTVTRTLPPSVAFMKQTDLNEVVLTGYSSTSPLSANSIAGSIGTFIATRFKQEVETAFLSHLRDWITNKKYHLTFEALLPETRTVLTLNNVYQYTSFLQSLREAFTKDLANFPQSLEKYLANPQPNDPLLATISKEKFYYDVIFLYNEALQIKNINSLVAELISWRNSPDPLFDKAQSIKPYLQLISAISFALTDDPDKDDPQFITPQEISAALNPSNDNLRYFMGLFILENKKILQQITLVDKNSNTTSLYTLLNKDMITVNKIAGWLRTLCTQLSDLASTFDKVKKEVKSNKLVAEDVAACVNSLTVSISDALNFPAADLGFTIDPAFSAIIGSVAQKTKILNEMVVDLQNKSYGLLTNHFVDLLISCGVPADGTALDVVKKYGSFAVSVVSATNQQEVISALETAALPVGSYRVKRNSYLNVELNAYGGAFGAYQQYVSSTLPAGVKSTNWLAGFTAPVGISFNWGFLQKKSGKLSGLSGSIFASIIDVGAITAFRLQHDATSTLPNFSWSNILAPGGYFVLGLKNSPLSLGIGSQYGPQLRSITSDAATVVPSAWTWRAFLAIDIPIFDFYTKATVKDNGL